MRVFLVLLIAFGSIIAQETDPDSLITPVIRLPELRVNALDGIKIILPDSALGFITLITFGFQRESQVDMNTWLFPFAKEFADSTKYNYFEVPMMGNRIPGFLRSFINRGMRRSLPKDKYRKVLPYYGDIDAYAKKLVMNDRSRVHVFLLDKKGIIRWLAQGPATGELLNQLRKITKELTKEEL